MAGFRAPYKFKKAQVWMRRVRLNRIVELLLAVTLAASGAATIVAMTDLAPLDADLTTVIILLNVDVVLALALGVMIVRRIVRGWARRRIGPAGTRLHIRLVVLFSLAAVIPAILVAVFSGLFLNFGIESWFSERVRTAVTESQAVANAYLHEHQQNIRIDALAMANDLNRAAPQLRGNARQFQEYVTTQALVRELPEVLVVDGAGRPIARSGLSFSLGFDLATQDFLQRVFGQVRSGDVVIIGSDSDDRVRAGVKLEAYVDAYLIVGRFIAPQVLDHVSTASGAIAQYRQLEASREELQVRFLLIFGLVAVLLLLAAVWTGWSVATQLATPIGNLIAASERIRKGDLTARVDLTNGGGSDEIGTLGRVFNRMTEQLENQRQGLVEANRELDERRRFTETVLSGVSAGVIGLDKEGRVHLPNRSASELLATDLEASVGKPFAEVVPEMVPLFEAVMRSPHRAAHGEVSVYRGGRERTLLAGIASETLQEQILGYVVTFDDVTELVSAQRKAAWADVARRIAHEIKNPLTPIRLSAERLKRRYKKEIVSDPDVFDMCTETIVRQVEDIRRMVDEFSAFARMPQPEFKMVDLTDLCRQALFLERNRSHSITYLDNLTAEPILFRCDSQQISRALVNILKNAAESVTARVEENGDQEKVAQISLSLEESQNAVTITVHDNGKGLPPGMIDRLTEPYVTTREKGTGLGLAIVKKIMEDHHGDLVLQNDELGGAIVELIFHRDEAMISESGAGKEDAAQETLEAQKKSLAHGA